MKKQFLFLVAASATLFLAGARAAAPQAPAAPPAPALDPAQQELLRRYDLNHDGKLDDQELAAAHEAMLRDTFAAQASLQQSLGGPGSERAKLVRAQLLKKFDVNHDGQLDEDERAAAKKFFLDRYDRNHDGRLDEAERAAMRADLKARAKARGANN